MEGAPVVEAPSAVPRSTAPPVTTPLDPGARIDTPSLLAEEGERVYVASQWLLIWWRFRKHKLALLSGIVLIGFYTVVLAADFLSTNPADQTDALLGMAPPQPVYWFDGLSFAPYVHPIKGNRDPLTLKRGYVADTDTKIPVRLFAPGFDYQVFGLFSLNRHLLGLDEASGQNTRLFLLGTDVQGRDLWSRLMNATRTSLTIGLVGVALSLLFGVVLGGLSGFYGGFADIVIQRVIEIFRSVPTIPLWMGLAAALPPNWSVTQVYFGITLILSLVAWTEMARVVRGRFLSLREEDFVTAAMVAGAGQLRTIFRHMLPSFYSHIIAATTLALPAMILSETALSFLGLGLRPPAVSYGVLLQQAQNVQSVALAPWLLLPAVPVVVAVLAFNFLGDGIRDAADPYGV
jgi:peptide/nickel transport system permease protein